MKKLFGVRIPKMKKLFGVGEGEIKQKNRIKFLFFPKTYPHPQNNIIFIIKYVFRMLPFDAKKIGLSC